MSENIVRYKPVCDVEWEHPCHMHKDDDGPAVLYGDHLTAVKEAVKRARIE